MRACDNRIDARLALLGKRHLCHIDLGSDAPPPPDYSGIASANEQSALYAKEAADAELAFRQKQYDDSLPYLKTSQELGMKIAGQQSDIADYNQTTAKEDRAYWEETYKPVEKKVASDAMEYDSEARQEQVAGDRRAQVSKSFANQRASAARELEAMGVNPNSGRFAGLSATMDMQQALGEAATMNAARTEVQDKGIALRSGAANFGRNMPNTASAAFNTAVGAGSSATQNATTGANAAIPWTNTVGAGYGMQQNAANTSIQSQLGLGGLMNGSYGTTAQLAAGEAAGNGQALGAVAGLAGAMMFSDRRLKHMIKPTGASINGIPLYEYAYLGCDRIYIGVMSDDVRKVRPECVHKVGHFDRVNYAALGVRLTRKFDQHAY